MVGFFDGISHPVLGFDHFLAMVSVGIISAQIGARAIWTIPTTFVFIMIIGASALIFQNNSVYDRYFKQTFGQLVGQYYEPYLNGKILAFQ